MNLNELLQNAVDHGACEDSINYLKNYQTVEDASDDSLAPYYVYWYAENVLKGRWKECEHIILRSPRWTYMYAHYVINGRWEQGECVILLSPEYSYRYALNVIKGRWEEAEPIIFSGDYYKEAYYTYVVNLKETQ